MSSSQTGENPLFAAINVENNTFDLAIEEMYNGDIPSGNLDKNSSVGCDASSNSSINGVPCVGMEFITVTDAYNFYNSYALRVGFGARKTSNTYSQRKNEEKKLIGTSFVCDKEGKKSDNGNHENRRDREARVGCRARMRIVLTVRNTWAISTFIEAHNGHVLTSPNKAMKHRSHNIIHKSQPVINLMDRLRDQGLARRNISRALNAGYECVENAITPQQCQTHLRKSRTNNVGTECRSIIKQFHMKRMSDPDFYSAWEAEEDGTMRSVFWADGRSRCAYLQFGDVLVFDVTYKTNKLCLPFALFTGVNHHNQSILFGCALLADEQEETFVWLFSEWLACMHGQAPSSIITDQDIAIGNAVRRVFPTSRHRYCSWHIGQHIVQHLPKLRADHGEGVGLYLTKWMKSTNVEEAELRWIELKENLKNIDENANTWLATMYRKRQHWVHAYLNDAFWAGMQTTQRSESMNAFFDGYVNAQTRLHEFISCYDKALQQRRAAELHEDFMTLSTRPAIADSHAIEVQAGNVYTRNLFKKFLEEMKGTNKLVRKEESRDGSTVVYSVSSTCNDKTHYVVYEEGESVSAKCSCALFETAGLLCRHILSIVCAVYQLQAILEKYILQRWRIDARHRSIRNLMHGSEEGILLKSWVVRADFCEAWEMAANSNELLLEMHEWLTSFKARHGLVAKRTLNDSRVSSNQMVQELELPDNVSIRDPSGPVGTKGRPKKPSRYQTIVEQKTSKRQKRQRTCQNCGQKGHYRSTCKNPPAISLHHNEDDGDDNDDDGDDNDNDGDDNGHFFNALTVVKGG